MAGLDRYASASTDRNSRRSKAWSVRPSGNDQVNSQDRTHSEDGRRCRDTFLSLKKTCQKNAISFWDYLGDRLGIAANTAARLPDIIRARAAPAPA